MKNYHYFYKLYYVILLWCVVVLVFSDEITEEKPIKQNELENPASPDMDLVKLTESSSDVVLEIVQKYKWINFDDITLTMGRSDNDEYILDIWMPPIENDEYENLIVKLRNMKIDGISKIRIRFFSDLKNLKNIERKGVEK